MTADDVRHILKRHGAEGRSDHTMKDPETISKISYVLANYDDIEWDGGVSRQHRTADGNPAPQVKITKQIDGYYYVIEVISDSRKGRNYVVTAYLQNK